MARDRHEELLQQALARCAERAVHDEELRSARPPSDEIGGMLAACRSSIELLALTCQLHARRASFGERAFDVVDGSVRYRPEYRTITYADLWARLRAFASGLHHARLAGPGDRVGICGFSRTDWVVADLACLFLAAVSVPLPINAPPGELARIIADAEARCLVVSLEQLALVASVLPRLPLVSCLVVMGYVAEDRAQADAFAEQAEAIREEHGEGVAVWSMAEVERLGHERGPIPYVDPAVGRAGERDPLMTLIYTSGSTGVPKGAMFPEVPPAERVVRVMQVALGIEEIDLDQSFLQLGGDSLLAVRLTSLLEEHFGVSVPVGLVLDPSRSARTIVELVTSHAWVRRADAATRRSRRAREAGKAPAAAASGDAEQTPALGRAAPAGLGAALHGGDGLLGVAHGRANVAELGARAARDGALRGVPGQERGGRGAHVLAVQADDRARRHRAGELGDAVARAVTRDGHRLHARLEACLRSRRDDGRRSSHGRTPFSERYAIFMQQPPRGASSLGAMGEIAELARTRTAVVGRLRRRRPAQGSAGTPAAADVPRGRTMQHEDRAIAEERVEPVPAGDVQLVEGRWAVPAGAVGTSRRHL